MKEWEPLEHVQRFQSEAVDYRPGQIVAERLRHALVRGFDWTTSA